MNESDQSPAPRAEVAALLWEAWRRGGWVNWNACNSWTFAVMPNGLPFALRLHPNVPAATLQPS